MRTIKVRDRRKALGMSQQQLANKTGISRNAISDIETGKHEPSVWIAGRIAEALDCLIEDLFQEKPP